jgi:FkbM family methyltransferase
MVVKYLKSQVRQFRLRRAGLRSFTCAAPIVMGGWALWPQSLNAQSVVYSFGVGDDVGWDLAMIERFGMTVHAFDPTPASIAWVSQQSLPPQFVFHDCGISNFDGELDFFPPRHAGSTHYSQEPRGGLFFRAAPVAGRVERLSTIMQRLGHRRIDVLKLDVEGAEFEAIPDLVASGVEVDQLLVEIHYQFRSRSFSMAMDLIDRLKNYGLHCRYVSPRGYEFSFVHERLMEQPLLAELFGAAA